MLVEFFENRGSAAALAAGMKSLRAVDLADLFVDVSFLGSALRFLSEAHWLRTKDAVTAASDFSSFVKDSFDSELSPILFLRDVLLVTPVSEYKNIASQVAALEKMTLQQALRLDSEQQRAFAERSLNLMAQLFAYENYIEKQKKSLGLSLNLSLYRSFDGLDEVFGLDYKADAGMKANLQNPERLYEGSGMGVQSSYATILQALREVQPRKGARWVDLGSGFGRVGLTLGLVRPDLQVTGFEYVDHRVQLANLASRRFALNERVQFHTQDLAAADFKIPEADVYYMYDPFSAATYRHVLAQLVDIAKKQAIIVVTKGDARTWLLEVAESQSWAWPDEFDSGNLCIFRS